MLTLISTRKHPPGGFRYKCPKCKWVAPNPLMPWLMVVREIQQHRVNNPGHGLSAEQSAVAGDLEEQNCRRLGAGTWCKDMEAEMVMAHEKVRTQRQCKGCGRKRKKQ